MKAYLQIKCMSLAAEARIIRRSEQRHRKSARILERSGRDGTSHRAAFWGLRIHRTYDVRYEARSSHLAYGFLLGRRYRQMERAGSSVPDWKRVQALVEKYGQGDKRELVQRFSEWKEEA